MRILFCTSEAAPYAASGGLGDVAGSLPTVLNKDDQECRVVMPLYRIISERYRDQLQFVCSFNVDLGWRSQYCGVFEMTNNGVKHYFLDNQFYFFREGGIYGYLDDGERYAFFSKAIIEMLFYIDYDPDILHLNDWQTALVPVLLKTNYGGNPKTDPIKTLFTIHNIQYQGKYGDHMLGDVMGMGDWERHLLEYGGAINFMKGALETADWINTVSPTYAQELQYNWFAYGLDSILRAKKYKLSGILNGIDVEGYNPATDKVIASTYTTRAFAKGKAACKKALCEYFSLEDDSRPIIAMVTRLVTHKGIDLVRHMAQQLINDGFNIVVLGSGDGNYEAFLNYLAEQNPGKVGVYLGFVPDLARKIYAGADMFLMPSKSEPCGLSQMISARYGTIPIVRETGGLNDSIKDNGDGKGNGYTFQNYNAHEMYDCCMRAKKLYDDAKSWKSLAIRCMKSDFSWDSSAKKYVELYDMLKKG